MKDILNHNKIEYIFFHLNYIFDLNREIRENIAFIKNGEKTDKYQNKIIF